MAIRSVEHQVITTLIDTEIENLIRNELKDKKEDKQEEDRDKPEEDITLLKNILSNTEKEEPKLSVSALDRGLEVLPQQISIKQQLIQQELDELQKLQNEEAQNADGQLIAGIDTSIETVDSYIEDIFAQIRERGPQFLNAFLTPIYKDPLEQLQLL